MQVSRHVFSSTTLARVWPTRVLQARLRVCVEEKGTRAGPELLTVLLKISPSNLFDVLELKFLLVFLGLLFSFEVRGPMFLVGLDFWVVLDRETGHGHSGENEKKNST